MIVKFKKLHPDAVLPKHAKYGDAGMDLTAVHVEHDNERIGLFTYYTGIAVEIPAGYVGLLFPRSSVYKTHAMLTNCVGVIDSGYRGELMFKYKYDRYDSNTMYKPGDRVGQLVIMPYMCVSSEWAEELTVTERGENGFGHTGR
jgi:dUTP pyrophosphatase